MTKKAETTTKPTTVTDVKPTEPVAEDAETESTVFDIFLDQQRKAAVEAGKALEGLVPAGLREHGSAAFREMVEGYRQLFNAAIDRVVDRIERVKVDRKEEESADGK
ncbi:MAG: hypothetical protein ACOCX5_04740 [Chloroflexota bacterium]